MDNSFKKTNVNPADKRDIASDYPWTPYRVEWRPTYGLHTRDVLAREMDALQQAGVKAWWYSAAAKGSYPLFRSKHLPYRDDADTELFQWLTAESHRRNMSIISWEYLNTAPMLAAQKPEWRYRWLDHDGDETDERETQFVCYNSPYGDLLMNYCVEVVGELGFDGIWFDGSTLIGVSTAKQRIGCCCDWCKEKYRQQTGAALPQHVDLADPAFRRYINWRYADFMDYWARLSDYVDQQCPSKLIVMNHFNRLRHGWESGTPLRRTPNKVMISTEAGPHYSHLLLQHKYHRAINNNVPVEVWTNMRDGASQRPFQQPEPDPAAAVYLCKAAATCGGYMSFGLGDSPVNTQQCLASLSEALEPIQPYIGGESEKCIGLVLSGATKDFFYDDPYKGWKHIHGAHNLFNALHWPTDIILDNMFDLDTLKKYQAVVLPDVRCLSDEAAKNLRAYVENGGTVLAFGDIGTHDLDGNEREQPVLDDFLGIQRQRDEGESGPRGSGPDDLFGSAKRRETVLSKVIIKTENKVLGGNDLPGQFMISGDFLPTDTADNAEIIASTTYNTADTGKRFSAQGLIPPEKKMVTCPVIFARNHGSGRVITIRSQLDHGYAEQPHRRSREVVRRLLADRVQPPFTTDAPADVVVTPWRQGDRLVFHLLQMPSALLRFNNDTVDLGDIYCPEEMPRLDSFVLTVRGDWQKAFSPVQGACECRRVENSLEVSVPPFEKHDVVVLSR